MATVTSSGGFKPSTTDTPLDVRTRVNTYAEIKDIQNPYIGMEITVLEDETNNGKKTKYEVVDLLPNEAEIPNALINIDTLKRKIDIYEDNGNLIIGDSDDESSSKKLQTKRDDSLLTNNKEIPEAINELKLAIDNVEGGSSGGNGLTTTQSQQLQTAYQHSQSPHITTDDVNTAVQTYVDDNINLLKGDKGDKGDKGEQGLQGIKGDKGEDGLTTSVKVGSQTFTQNEGLITLTGVATENFVTTKISEAKLSGGTGGVDLSGYATKDELNDKADKASIPTKTSQLKNDSSYLKSTDTIDADSLNGKKFSDPMTKQEYDAITNKDSNTIYLVDDDSTINGVPDYSSSDANKILAVNAEGNALAWIDAPSGSVSGDVDISNLASDLSLSGTSLQLKNSNGNLIGTAVTLPSGGSSKQYWLTGKKWLVLGDSITDATVNTGGDKYYKFISDMVGGCTIVNHGYSGIKVAGLTTKLDTIDATGVQVVTALIGVNDWNFPVPLGKEGDTGTDTEYGIIYNFVLKLVTKFPRITVLGLIPLPCQASNGVLQATCSEGFSLKQLTDAIKYTYELFSVPYLDLFNQSGIHATIPSSRDFYFSDGLHPTVNAHKAIANKILSFIENNYFDYNYETSSNIAVTSVSLSDTSKTVNKNDSFTLTATISPSTATNQSVTFSANNSNVSISQSGLSATITGVTEGTSIVTVTTEDGNNTATCNVTVTTTSSGTGETMDVVSDGTATFIIGGINIGTGESNNNASEVRLAHCIPLTLAEDNSITISSGLIGQSATQFTFGMALYDENNNWLESRVGTDVAKFWHSTSTSVAVEGKIYINNAKILPPNNSLASTPVKMKVSLSSIDKNANVDLTKIKGRTFTINNVTYTIQ